MKATEIRNLSTQELKEKITAEREALVKLKVTQVVSELSNPSQITQKRKVVARLLTDLRRRELSENN